MLQNTFFAGNCSTKHCFLGVWWRNKQEVKERGCMEMTAIFLEEALHNKYVLQVLYWIGRYILFNYKNKGQVEFQVYLKVCHMTADN